MLEPLVKFRKYVSDVAQANTPIDISNKMAWLSRLRDHVPPQTGVTESLDNIMQRYRELSEHHYSILNDYTTVLDRVDSTISEYVSNTFLTEESLEQFSEYKLALANESNSLIDRKEYEFVKTKIQKYSDWHYPGLIINARHRRWISAMTASEPLYLTRAVIPPIKGVHDVPDEFFNADAGFAAQGLSAAEMLTKLTLADVVNTFSELYQRRLRLYTIKDRDFSKLPQNQFNLILIPDYFNQINCREARDYVESCFSLLRPGGVVLFNYNNCDLAPTAKIADLRTASYCSATMVKQWANEFGYEIASLDDWARDDAFHAFSSWAELRRPGTLSTVKAFSSIGKIIEG